MPSRCDRLGELLNAALTEGRIPAEMTAERMSSGSTAKSADGNACAAGGHVQEDAAETASGRADGRLRAGKRRQKRANGGGKTENHAADAERASVIPRESLLPVCPPEVLAAYYALGLTADSPKAAVKKNYRTLLKKYHPDNTAPFENMQRTAAQKTDQIVQAFKTLEAWFERHS